MKKIYILHEYGAPSHFFGLEYIANKKSIKLYHRELNYYRQLGSSIKHLDFDKLHKFLINLGFIISMFFRKNQTIVLGIAPYNFYLKYLRIILRKNNIFYFTSYSCWNQKKMVHSKYYSDRLLLIWKDFINYEVAHIFTVSQKACDELVRNGFSIRKKITVVNHSYKEEIVPSSKTNKTNEFIYVGRLTKTKGIEELLQIFEKLPNCKLTIIGDGDLKINVINASKNNNNIIYKGYINGLESIIPIYKENSFILLNSQCSDSWEELFGISLIEGMACGLIPIATNHSGPKEIITPYLNGIICEESEILRGITYALKMKDSEYCRMKENSIIRAREFTSSNISKKWEKIFLQ